MKKHKIAIMIPSFEVGGAENMVAQLATNINQEKFEVMVIVLSGRKNTPIQEIIDKSNLSIKYLNKGIGLDYKIMINIYKILNEFKPNIVHTHLYSFVYSLPWIITHNVKMIHTVHNMPKFELSPKGRFIIDKLYRMQKAIPVAISKIIEEQMYETYNIKNIETIYNPVDIDRYLNERKYDEKEEFVFVAVGRLVKQKNHQLLINSFYRVAQNMGNVKLKIIGDGELKEDLMNLTKELKIDKSVEFLGNIKNVETYLQSSDVFVLSSIYEGLPLSVLEAMASGLPIIATNVGGVPDIVCDNGILVESNDLDNLSNEMMLIAKDNKRRKELGYKSFEKAQQFDISNITKQYEQIYIKYINGECNEC